MKQIKLKYPDAFLAYAKSLSNTEFVSKVETVIRSMADREFVGMETTITQCDRYNKWFISNLHIKHKHGPHGTGELDQWWFDSNEIDRFFEVVEVEPLKKPETISKDEVESYISTVHYFTAEQGIDNTNGIYGVDGIIEKHGRYLFCMITLKNGLVFHGTNSGGLNPDKYDRDFAENEAYKQAIGKVWEAVAIHKTFSK